MQQQEVYRTTFLRILRTKIDFLYSFLGFNQKFAIQTVLADYIQSVSVQIGADKCNSKWEVLKNYSISSSFSRNSVKFKTFNDLNF